MTKRSTSAGRLGVCAAVAAITVAAVACGSSGGGSFPDTGTVVTKPDSSTLRDTGTDTSMQQQHDVISIFGDTGPFMPDVSATDSPVSPQDAPADATEHGDAHASDAVAEAASHIDSGSEKDAHVVEASTKDAGCVAVTVSTDTSGFPACAAPVSGTCGPGSLASFHASAPPPATPVSKCSMAQIQSIYDGCLGTNGSGTACTTAKNAAQACYSCIFTSETAAKWGPTIQGTDMVVNLNVGGCLTLLEPCNAACGAVFEEDLQCEQAACSTNCPYASDPTGYGNCTTAIDDCAPNGCASYFTGTSCASSVTGPGSVCFANPNDFEAGFLAIVPLFCGG